MEVDLSDVPRVDFDLLDTSGNQKGKNDADVKQNKESSSTKRVCGKADHVFCQDMEVDDNKSLEKLGFVPNAVGEVPRSSTCKTRNAEKKVLQVL